MRPSAPARAPEAPLTYTILAVDRAAGLIGGATASRSLAVGNSVLALQPSVGVVASQAWTNRALRARLLDALAAGDDPATAVGRVPDWDDEPELRQVAALSVTGAGAQRTGASTTAWAGGIVGPDVVVVGNLLAGASVLEAMRASFVGPGPGDDGPADEEPARRFAGRLVAALRAGEGAGGDLRGRQSAALLVARTGEDVTWPPALAVDLRADDHPDPPAELARLVALPGAVATG